MANFPVPTTLIFLLTVLAVAAAFVIGVRQAGARLGEAAQRTRRWTLLAASAAMAWLAVTGLVGASGVLRDYSAAPPPFMIFLAACTALTIALAASSVGLRLVNGVSLAWLVGFQAFRISVEWVLFSLHDAGVVPVQMTFEGRNFDILSGITALGAAWLARQNKLSTPVLLLWNLLGLGLLVNIVTVAVLSAPLPFRLFLNDPANTFVTYLPYVWLPAVLVQAALFGHLLVFRRLWRGTAAVGLPAS